MFIISMIFGLMDSIYGQLWFYLIESSPEHEFNNNQLVFLDLVRLFEAKKPKMHSF
jgi:hypothetical protein